MQLRSLLLVAVVLFGISTDAAPRRRAAGKPVVDLTTSAGWLSHYARPLITTDFVPYSFDLEPLRNMIGDAVVVGLGDGTHGTHEFYTVKLRVIDFLVRELNFDVVAFEGPFPLTNRINTYVQGGAGDARELVSQMAETSGYLFWDTEEIVAVVEWMREYNLMRGARPAIEIVATDVYEEPGLAANVIEYLRGVDPAAADAAAQRYSCLTPPCDKHEVTKVYTQLAARETELIARTSFRAYHDALQSARTLVQSFEGPFGRDKAMAANVQWTRTHRGTSGKVIYWAHNEHVTKGESPWTFGVTAGHLLRESLGDAYFSIGTLAAAGSFAQWDLRRDGTRVLLEMRIPPPSAGAYEPYFAQHGASILLVPLRGDVPAWLAGPAFYNTSTIIRGLPGLTASLPAKFDAVIYIHATTPLRLLPN